MRTRNKIQTFFLVVTVVVCVILYTQIKGINNIYAAVKCLGNCKRNQIGYRKIVARATDHSDSSVLSSQTHTQFKKVNSIQETVFKDQTKLSVFLLSAFAKNETLYTGFENEIMLVGWEALKHKYDQFKCCVRRKNSQTTVNAERGLWKRGRLSAVTYLCPVAKNVSYVTGVAITHAHRRCPRNGPEYIKPMIPQKQHDQSFAICAKIVYGGPDVKSLIHWFEFYKVMKVDKIVMFTYNITASVSAVLKYYQYKGILDLHIFDYPWKVPNFVHDVGVKNQQSFEDEQVTVFDCAHRLEGYTYVAILDLDEFLLPRQHGNFREMMRVLTITYPDAGGFTFQPVFFIKDWGVSGKRNGSVIERYVQRTGPINTRAKNVMVLRNVNKSTVHTHEFTPLPGYVRVDVPPDITTLNHYRTCYSNLGRACNDSERIVDTHIFRFMKMFKGNADSVFKRLFGLGQ